MQEFILSVIDAFSFYLIRFINFCLSEIYRSWFSISVISACYNNKYMQQIVVSHLAFFINDDANKI